MSSTDARNDLNIYRRRFCAEANRLFSRDVESIEYLGVFSEDQELRQRVVSGREDIIRLIQKNECARESIYIIRQENTLSRLLVTQEGFQIILDAYNVFPEFFDVAMAFGFRRDDDHKAWDGYHMKTPESKDSHVFEFSFVLRYMEKHNRSPKRPWSLRQVGVYHKVEPCNGKSTWVILQPSGDVYEGLKSRLESKSKLTEQSLESCYLFYLDLLASLSRSWGEYMEYLWAEVEKLDDKACFSVVGFEKRNDYTVEFADCQKLQRLRRTLLRTLAVLDSSLLLADGIRLHLQKMQNHKVIKNHEFIQEISTYKNRIRAHKRNQITMLKYVEGTRHLLSNILSSRNDKTVLDTSLAMQKSLELTQRIAEQGKKDSELLKLLGIIATVYLPASLLAAIFSSNLVQIKPTKEGDEYFQAAPQFWIYIVLAVFLTIITLACAYVALRLRSPPSARKPAP